MHSQRVHPFPRRSSSILCAVAILIASALGACGGGSGGSAPASPVPGTPGPVTPAPGAPVVQTGAAPSANVLAGVQSELQFPIGMAMDKAGNILVIDASTQLIHKITPQGVMTALAGSRMVHGFADGQGDKASFSFNYESRAMVDAAGNLIVTDTCNNTVRRITPEGLVSTVAGTQRANCIPYTSQAYIYSGDTRGTLSRPGGIALDANGDYLVLSADAIVQRITPAGQVSAIKWAIDSASTSQLGRATNIATGKDGVVYASDASRIYRITNGVARFVAGGPPANGSRDGQGAAAGFSRINGLALDASGNLYITQGGAVRKMTPDGLVTTVAGNHVGPLVARDGSVASATFNTVGSMAFDAQGVLTMVDVGADAVRQLSPQGVVSTLAATPLAAGERDGAGAAARFGGIGQSAVDSKGNFYLAEPDRAVVRRVGPDGAATVFAGIPGTRNEASATALRADALYYPTAVAVDARDAVYVADGQRVLKFEGGVMRTISSERIGNVTHIAVDADGNLALAAYSEVILMSADGKIVRRIDYKDVAPQAMEERRSIPGIWAASVAFDRNGNLYLADLDHGVILKGGKTGAFTLFAGTPNATGQRDGPARTGLIGFYSGPQMAFAPDGDMYLSGNGKVRKIAPDGTISTPALAWGLANIGSVSYGNGKLMGMAGHAVVFAPLPR
ncbi:hypothetical protein INH39_24185 [Massilia violaceinigra]|uniref:SMP-30/Gluconolactonase/LRE-like region domain-containing protein n=1 Tax=Massilia violaceinigra TaxID=2045208 RepID=A0ABY4A4P3_9BURK|nr:hypothetical protein [Massilia violaceinigra]UOD28526.1 hypothetical protein INH39_24185 [Massilia violaceinigra]